MLLCALERGSGCSQLPVLPVGTTLCESGHERKDQRTPLLAPATSSICSANLNWKIYIYKKKRLVLHASVELSSLPRAPVWQQGQDTDQLPR